MLRGKAMRNPNGYGSVVKLSGNRRNPFEVRVNTKLNEWGYPVYDVLGRFPERQAAVIALAKYNETLYALDNTKITFAAIHLLPS